MFAELFSMYGNYESRKVDRYTDGVLVISTAYVADGTSPYETAVAHPDYRPDGSFVIVEAYETTEEAQAGHDRWVKTMTTEPLPAELRDCQNAEIAQLIDSEGLVYPRKKKTNSRKKG